MNPKHSLIFFSGGIILILGFVLFGVVPTNILSESEPNDDGVEPLLVEENIAMQIDSKPIGQMNCTELNEFILSFEKGWGNAIPLYNEKCS